MRKDNRKFIITVNGRVIYREVTVDYFDSAVKDLLASGFTLDDIQVWVEGNFRLIPERFEVD